MELSTQRKIKNTTIITILAILLGIVTLQVLRFYRAVAMLKSIAPQSVTLFRIYPRTTAPIGTPVEFTYPDLIVQEFFNSIKDIKAYRSTPGSIISDNAVWFLEIVAQGKPIIQMDFCISHYSPGIVIGSIEGPGYGRFQSQQMLEWYKRYSHRWLELEP